jgi:fido (protein-threonine AMPylation protein)
MNEAGEMPLVADNSDRIRLWSSTSSPIRTREADIVAYRLVELQCSPIRGGFDTAHLQNIHHYIYQGLYDHAGELRSLDAGELAEVDPEQSLNKVLDLLSADNYLRGLSSDDWTSKAVEFITELDAMRPFAVGSDVALREFAVELARKNQIGLDWDASPTITDKETQIAFDEHTQSANLRRMIMLAMDKDSGIARPRRGDTLTLGIERPSPLGSYVFDR